MKILLILTAVSLIACHREVSPTSGPSQAKLLSIQNEFIAIGSQQQQYTVFLVPNSDTGLSRSATSISDAEIGRAAQLLEKKLNEVSVTPIELREKAGSFAALLAERNLPAKEYYQQVADASLLHAILRDTSLDKSKASSMISPIVARLINFGYRDPYLLLRGLRTASFAQQSYDSLQTSLGKIIAQLPLKLQTWIATTQQGIRSCEEKISNALATSEQDKYACTAMLPLLKGELVEYGYIQASVDKASSMLQAK